MVSAPYARKNGEKTKIAVRAVKAYISKSILPIAWTVTYIYICTGPADTRPAWPDLQTHGRTHRWADGHAEARTDTQTGGRTRRSTDADARTQKHGRRRTDADASTRTLNICACSTWVEKSSRRVLRLDERTRTFEVYYICHNRTVHK